MSKLFQLNIASILPVFDGLATLQQGKDIYGFMVRSEFESDTSVVNAFLDLYMKLGSVEDARQVFDNITRRNVSWNLMITGYSRNGQCVQALEFFKQMQLAGVKPSVMTWNFIITGYSQNGHCEEAFKSFSEMQLAGIKPISIILTSLLLACTNNIALQEGKHIQIYIIKSGYESDEFVVSALLYMYTETK